MKDAFSGYYRPTGEEFSELWKKALFVLDANVLLNLYRYSPDTRQELLDVLKDMSDRLWLPHQAGLEYQENRLGVIAGQAARYDEVQKHFRKALETLRDELDAPSSHPFVEVGTSLDDLQRLFGELEQKLESGKPAYEALLEADTIRDTITALLEGKVGRPYPPEKMAAIAKEGQRRYEAEVPPGYCDRDKGGHRQYGDLVLWFQIIDKAKDQERPVILVTDDRKEDWWWKPEGKTIGPRPQLVQEMRAEADVPFYMYSMHRFMKYAQDHTTRQIRQEAIDEVGAVRERDEELTKQRYGELLQAFTEHTTAQELVAEVVAAHRKALAEIRGPYAALAGQITGPIPAIQAALGKRPAWYEALRAERDRRYPRISNLAPGVGRGQTSRQATETSQGGSDTSCSESDEEPDETGQDTQIEGE